MIKPEEMKRGELLRFAGNPVDRSIGRLLVEGERQAVFTMEPGTHDPRGACVPEGTYLAQWIQSPTYGWTWTLIGEHVSAEPDGTDRRNQIRIHPFNDDDESLGCIGPGLSIVWDDRDMEPSVLQSRAALDKLIEQIGREDFLLVIRSGSLPAA